MTVNSGLLEPHEIPSHVPADRIVDFDYLADPDLMVDPQAAYQRLHAGPDLIFTPRYGGHWIATRQAVMVDVFHNPEVFSNFPRIIPRSASAGRTPQPFSDIDPPANGKYRLLLQQVLNPRAVTRFESEAKTLMVELVEGVRNAGACDFSPEIAQKMPTFIIMRWLELPFEDRFKLMELVDDAIAHPEPKSRMAAKEAIEAYVDVIVNQRRGQGGDDLITHIVDGMVEGRPVEHWEARAMVFNLIAGGLDTVRNMMSFIAWFLATRPDHRQELVDDPSLIPNAVEELLRWASIANMSRSVKQDIDFHGVTLKAGDMILMPLCLAGRDDRVFDDDARVNFRRDKVRHLAFGTGHHLCPGMHLARIELRVFLEEWLSRIPDFTLKPGSQPIARGGNILAVRELQLVWPH